MAELATKYSLHPNMITNWKRQAIDNMVEGFSSKADRTKELDEAQLNTLDGDFCVAAREEAIERCGTRLCRTFFQAGGVNKVENHFGYAAEQSE